MAREVLIPKEWEYTKQIQKIIKKTTKQSENNKNNHNNWKTSTQQKTQKEKKQEKTHWLRNVILKDTLGKLAEKWKN